MFWGCIGLGRLGHLAGVPVAMNQNDYVNILSQHILASAQDVFRQTNPRYQISQSTTYSGPHTGYDPLWNCMEMANEKNVDPPEMLEQLKQRVQQLWNESTPHTLRGLYHQILQRICLLRLMRDYPAKY